MTALVKDARQLADYILQLPGFILLERHGFAYSHMGAILADTILQAGVSYDAVVRPRVASILESYPQARTAPSFHEVVEEVGAPRILCWSHPEKPTRLRSLLAFVIGEGIATHDEFATWLASTSNRVRLQTIRGIGPKTTDYLAGLVGVDLVAVDRHLSRLVLQAGIQRQRYGEVREIVSFAADLLGVSRRSLDYSIWTYRSTTQLKLRFSNT